MSCNYHLLPHEGIRSLHPYVPSKAISALNCTKHLGEIIKLAGNENPLGCSAHATASLAAITNLEISHYPAPTQHPLLAQLAQKLGVTCDMISFANGSDVLTPLLLSCFALHCDKHMLTHQYAFIAYEIYAQSLGIPVIKSPLTNWQVDIDALIGTCNEKTGLIFLASPNNPTGALISQAKIEKILQKIPASTILVVDEAYYEYVDDIDKLNTIALLPLYPNLVITRTFSKVYGLAGLRLGYAIANRAISTLLQRISAPFAVNQAALIAAHAALADQDFIEQSILNNRCGLAQIKLGLDKLGIAHLPTAANFIMFDCTQDTTLLVQSLEQHRIIIRPLHPYGLDNYLRVSIGTPSQNSYFLDKLKELYHG